MAKIQSVEPNIADLVNGWLKDYELDYKLEQESLNDEIDKALSAYASKSGGRGGNRPDVKILIQDQDSNMKYFPVLIEYKGYKDKLVKLDSNGQVANTDSKNQSHYQNINSYAVNGAVHYANAILHHTSYTDVIAIGVTGYKDSFGELQHSVGVYYVSKDNLGVGQEVDQYTDLSFLKLENFNNFIKKINELSLTPEELDRIREKKEKEINASLMKLNNDVYRDEKGLSENDRVYLVAASIMATLGIPGKVTPLEQQDLKSSIEVGNTDGDIIIRKIEAFLSEKKLPTAKKDLIIRTLKNTLATHNINKPVNGESQLKRVFVKIVDDLGIYYKIGLTTDFTGKLFNEMYSWLGFSQDKLNDVVLTPSYVAKLLVKLARVDKDSYVWDFATGSAGLLVAAMNEMMDDATETIKSPEELEQKYLQIKAEQLLGLEVLSNVYMLAILNMIMMGDGSSNILNRDSLNDFDGNYGFGKTGERFPADAFILNPPYSAEGNGMIFVEKALSMMEKGYAAIIIQNSAGSGKAIEYNKKILKHSTLLASIKMPSDLFIGKSSVQTNIYVFRVGEPHHKKERVKFINFSNDGYTRTNRKRARNNLVDSDRAKERYRELVNLVRFGRSSLDIFTENDYYEGTIDPNNGADWNQSAPTDNTPIFDDFKNTISDYLVWEVSNLLKKQEVDDCFEKIEASLDKKLETVQWGEYKLGDLFEITGTKSLDSNKIEFVNEGINFIGRTFENNGIQGKIKLQGFPPNEANTITATVIGNYKYVKLQKEKYYCSQNINKLVPKKEIINKWNDKIAYFFVTHVQKFVSLYDGQQGGYKLPDIKNYSIKLPQEDGKINFNFIEQFINELMTSHKEILATYLTMTRGKDSI